MYYIYNLCVNTKDNLCMQGHPFDSLDCCQTPIIQLSVYLQGLLNI